MESELLAKYQLFLTFLQILSIHLHQLLEIVFNIFENSVPQMANVFIVCIYLFFVFCFCFSPFFCFFLLTFPFLFGIIIQICYSTVTLFIYELFLLSPKNWNDNNDLARKKEYEKLYEEKITEQQKAR